MTGFSVGEQVVIRFGTRQGQRGKVLATQPGEVYQVKVEDGAVLLFSAKGLKGGPEGVQTSAR